MEILIILEMMETPDSVGYVNLGTGRTAKQISCGGQHTCVILDNDEVKCWGLGLYGRLGYGNTNHIGDDETPDSVGYVNLGTGRTAKQINCGGFHMCAILDNNEVKCWGLWRLWTIRLREYKQYWR